MIRLVINTTKSRDSTNLYEAGNILVPHLGKPRCVNSEIFKLSIAGKTKPSFVDLTSRWSPHVEGAGLQTGVEEVAYEAGEALRAMSAIRKSLSLLIQRPPWRVRPLRPPTRVEIEQG